MTATLSPALARFVFTVRSSGCPLDQMENFLRGGYVPQPKQLDFHAAARECDLPGGPTQVGLGGSRGPGKSHAVFGQGTLDDCQRVPGLKGLYLRKVGKKAKEQFEDLRRAVLLHFPHEYNRAEGVIYFNNDSRILIGHFNNESDIDDYLGTAYDFIIIEESTTLTETKRQAVADSNRSSIPGWRPRIYETTNPGGVGHADFKRRYIIPARTNTETDTRFIFATVEDNRFIDPDYRRRLEQNTGWRLRAYRYGDWDIFAGQYFVNFSPGVHVVEPFRLDPFGATWWLAMDYGFVHWNVCYLLCQVGERVYVADEHAARRQLPAENAAGIRAMVERNGSPFIRAFVAGTDVFSPRGTEKTIAQEYAAAGWELTPAKTDRVNGAGRIAALLGRPRPEPGETAIEPRLFIFNRCARLIENLPLMQHDPGRGEDVLKVNCDADTGEGGDDPYDALRYGLMEGSMGHGWGDNPLAGYRG
jgi:phage terminase large subunit